MPRVGPYEVFEPIARTTLGLHRLAALVQSAAPARGAMIVLEEDPEGRARLQAEAAVYSSVVHSGLLTVRDSGDQGGQSYLAHDWVPGRTLADLLSALQRAGYSLDPNDALFIATQLLQTLQAMHGAGWVHRGIRPDAVWLGDNGDVYLTGLFCAAQTGTAGQLQPPISQYCPPELTRPAPADPRSDVYGVGLMLRTMLLGIAPFEGGSPGGLPGRITTEDLPPIGTLQPRLTANLQRMVDAAVARDPGLRPPAAVNLRDELARILYDRDPSYGPGRLSALLRQVFPQQIAEAEQRRAALSQVAAPRAPSMDLLDTGIAPSQPAYAAPPQPVLSLGTPARAPSQLPPQPVSLTAPVERSSAPPPVAPSGSFPAPPSPQPASQVASSPPPPPPLPPEREGTSKLLIAFVVMLIVGVLGVGVAYASGGTIWQKLRIAFIGRKAGAVLTVESIPTGAELFLDGVATGRKTPVTMENIESQIEHEIKAVFEGKSQSESITLEAGQKHTMQLLFPDAVVRLKIASTPEGAELFMNDKPAKVFTPASLTLRTKEETKLELRKVGYINWTQTLTPKPGEDVDLNIKLEKSEELKAAEAAEAEALGKTPKKKRSAPAKKRRKRRRRSPPAEQAL